jgi:signal transduction histidine kinase
MRNGWPRASVAVGVVAVLTLGPLDLVQHYAATPGVAYGLSVLRAVPVLVCRWWPREAWWLALAGAVGTALVTMPTSPAEPWPWAVSSLGPLVALAGVLAARGNRRDTAVALGALTVVGAVLALVGRVPGGGVSVAAGTALCGLGAIVGDLLHGRSRVSTALAEERQVSATERARRALAEERARIARELHDVVAHHMSMITVQAETARYRLTDLPERAADEFTGIARLARASLTELRGLLSALRDSEDGPAFAPQPTLADLDGLAERIRTAGTPVELRVPGELAGLPSAVQLTGFRVVQEALSNVVRHASGAATTVSVSSGDVLEVEVVNERAVKPAEHPGGGHGLLGLRERVTLLGGTLEVDEPGGGWRVRAWIPVGEVP